MKILSVIGARPQFVKASVFRKYCSNHGVEEKLVHTGQHYDYDMSLSIFSELGVEMPDVSIPLKNRSHGGMTGELIMKLEEIFLEERPDFVNVYGDTNSTVAAALAAVKLHIPIIHIEAGLRSFNKEMPEEVNRIITDHTSAYLFCPTHDAVMNLKREGIQKNVYHVGDIMYDAIVAFQTLFKLPSGIKLDESKQTAIVTLHRAETLESKESLNEAIQYCRRFHETHNLIFPIHPNTKNRIEQYEVSTTGLQIIPPIGYLEMQGLLSEANLVLTDSGGLQKEAYFHQCDCITLRGETEWRETLTSGWNSLWKQPHVTNKKVKIDEYGDGDCAAKILKAIS